MKRIMQNDQVGYPRIARFLEHTKINHNTNVTCSMVPEISKIEREQTVL